MHSALSEKKLIAVDTRENLNTITRMGKSMWAAMVLVGCGPDLSPRLDTGEHRRVAVEIHADVPDAGARQQVEAAWYWCPLSDGGLDARLYHQPCVTH